MSVTYKAYPAMSFGVASFGVIGNRTLGLNDTRKITTALAAVAPSLGDLGVGGLFSPSSAFAWFVLPSGDETSIAKGEFMKCWCRLDVLIRLCCSTKLNKRRRHFGMV